MKNSGVGRLLAELLGLTLAYLLVLVFLNLADLGLARSKVAASLSLSSALGGRLGMELLQYALTLLAVHLFPAAAVTCLVTALRRIRGWGAAITNIMGLSLWALVMVWISVENSHQFPDSRFALQVLHDWPWLALTLRIGLPAVIVASTLAALCLPALNRSAVKPPVPRGRVAVVTMATLCATLVGGAALAYRATWPGDGQVRSADKPNVILIGVDSLRADRLDGSHAVAPNINAFFDEAAVFERAYTPLARTNAAWISILSGLYPKHHGARANLVELSAVRGETVFASELKRRGYQSAYASDEKRFSNIDRDYGFEMEVGPAIGGGDFLIGNFSDFPLVNLIVNTRLARTLFPYLHANRAAWKTYRPETFSIWLDDFLRQVDRSKPLFLSTHFCLPHWPFLDASGRVPHYERDADGTPIVGRAQQYDAALSNTDLQVERLLSSLESNGMLDNAIVVLFSDHGEAFGEWDSELFAEPLQERFGANAGHGSNVISESQFRVGLAIRGYGLQSHPARRIQAVTSLVDIMPTVFDWLEIPLASRHVDGQSQLGAIRGQVPKSHDERIIFLETGFSPPALVKNEVVARDALEQGLEYYRIDEATGRILMKEDYLEKVVRSKQRAAIRGDWKLAAAPRYGRDGHELALLNVTSGEWIVDREALARHPQFASLHDALQAFYEGELATP